MNEKAIIETVTVAQLKLSREDLLQVLKYRYATKAWDKDKKISDADMQTILEAARLAPTSFGFEPWKVIVRGDPYLFTPEEIYETAGYVPNVVFPCAALADSGTGRIAIYYGAADTNVGLAFTTVDEVVTYIKAHSKLQWGDDIAQDDF